VLVQESFATASKMGSVSIISTSSFEGQAVVRVEGDLDVGCVDELRTAVRSTPPASDLVIDLSLVPSIDNVGLGAVLGGVRDVRERGGHASIHCGFPAVRTVLGASGLDRLAQFF
jgi:anti-anti-sigma factor